MCWHELWHRLSFRSKSSRRIKLSRTVLTCLYSSPLWYQLAYCAETWSATSGFWVIWWPKWTLRWSFKLLGSFLGSGRLHCIHFLLWNFYELLAEILTPEHLPRAKDITLGKEKKSWKVCYPCTSYVQEVLLLSLQPWKSLCMLKSMGDYGLSVYFQMYFFYRGKKKEWRTKNEATFLQTFKSVLKHVSLENRDTIHLQEFSF